MLSKAGKFGVLKKIRKNPEKSGKIRKLDEILDQKIIISYLRSKHQSCKEIWSNPEYSEDLRKIRKNPGKIRNRMNLRIRILSYHI